jgi:hypothetical protein
MKNHPALQIQRVLAMPSKRYTRSLIHFWIALEIQALLAAPDQKPGTVAATTPCYWAVQTGLRLSKFDRTDSARCAPWGSRALHPERAKREMHSTDQDNRCCAENLVGGADDTPYRNSVPHSLRRLSQP